MYVTIRTHSCPHCNHVYWSNRSQLLICGNPNRVCPKCGGHFVDNDLYVEWDDMTKKQKKFWIHWHGSDSRKLANVFAWIMSPYAFALALSTIILWAGGDGGDSDLRLGITIAASIVVPLFVFLMWYSHRYYHFMKNYLKDKSVRESLERTRGYNFNEDIVVDTQKGE